MDALDPIEEAGLNLLPWLLEPDGETSVQLWRDLLQIRTAILRAVAELAAENATGSDIASLSEVLGTLERAEDNQDRQLADFEFFKVLAISTGNVLLAFVVESLEYPLANNHQLWQRLYPTDFKTDQHRACVRAVAEHDRESAGRAMFDYGQLGQLVAQDWQGPATSTEE